MGESGRGSRGVRVALGCLQRPAGKQAVAGVCSHAAATRALSSWREVEDDWHWPVGWAGLLGHWARPAAQCQAAVTQVSFFPFLFSFLFSDICF